jgi:hypothetical protein
MPRREAGIETSGAPAEAGAPLESPAFLGD